MRYRIVERCLFCLIILMFVFCQREYKSLLLQKVKEVLNSEEFSRQKNFQNGPILRVILPRINTNSYGTDEFYFQYQEHEYDESFYLITSSSQFNQIPDNCILTKHRSIEVNKVTFSMFQITNCHRFEFIRITIRNVTLDESPILLVQHQLGAVKSILHLMIQPKTLLPPDNQTRFKRSSGSNKCSLYPLQVDLSTLYERQYTVGGIVQIGNCQGDCSNEIHLLTFHARVRLLMKQRQSGRDSANLSPGHCGPEKYKSHKIMYIEPENEQMHIIMEIKDLVVDSCNCH